LDRTDVVDHQTTVIDVLTGESRYDRHGNQQDIQLAGPSRWDRCTEDNTSLLLNGIDGINQETTLSADLMSGH